MQTIPRSPFSFLSLPPLILSLASTGQQLLTVETPMHTHPARRCNRQYRLALSLSLYTKSLLIKRSEL